MTDRSFASYGEIIRHQATECPEKVAFEFEGQSRSYGELNRRSSQVANALIDNGLKPGDRVAYLGKNSIVYFEIFLGTSKAGGVPCPINWRLSPRELTYVLNDCSAEILFVGPEFADLAENIKQSLNSVRLVICLSPSGGLHQVYDDWISSVNQSNPDIRVSAGDDALQIYTSGTTGNPKGAILSNRSLLYRHYRDKLDGPEWLATSSEDVSLIAMPCFHVGGTGSGLRCIANGSTGIILREFDALRVLDFIDKYPISKMFMVPAALRLVVEHPRSREIDYSRLKYVFYGASPIPLDLLRKCIATFKCGFVQMYGMTETSGTVVALAPEDHDPKGNERMRSAGKPLPGVEIRIVDEAGRPLPPRTVGEIAIRTEGNMKGYWRLPDETRKVLDTAGELRTGDAGYMDEDGYLYIHDRMKDMIISGGENIYPAEIENALHEHADIAEVAVIGVPDQRWGEVVKAIVVCRNGKNLSESEIINWARERVAGYKCPKSVEFIDSLPRNPSGKVLRRELRAAYWVGSERPIG